MIEDIRKLAESDDAEVKAKAEDILMMHVAFEEGQITKEMYVELLEDIARTEDVETHADVMTAKAMLVTGVMGILQVI
jgi:hypothetical protein